PPGDAAAAGPPGRQRDLNPAVVHDGLAIIAPDNTPWLYAYGAETGRLVWKAPTGEADDIVHLLGVAKGRLIATGNHVYSFDVKTGKLLRAWPDNNPGTPGFGRGLIAGEHIYWPTKDQIFVLDAATGLKSDREPIPLHAFGVSGGNLAVGDGYLVVAQADSLVVFCQNTRLIERYREEIAKTPEESWRYYRLASVAEAIGQEDVALEAFGQAVRR